MGKPVSLLSTCNCASFMISNLMHSVDNNVLVIGKKRFCLH